jgi:hypothetical protein
MMKLSTVKELSSGVAAMSHTKHAGLIYYTDDFSTMNHLEPPNGKLCNIHFFVFLRNSGYMLFENVILKRGQTTFSILPTYILLV